MSELQRLLVLEDDSTYVELLRLRIMAEWPRCEMVHVCGQAAYVAELKKHVHDLIISDYLLPGYSGVAALAAAREICPDTPFVFVSGHIGDEIAVESLKLGATDYILKDRPARLVSAMRRGLEEAEASKRRKEAEQRLQQSFAEYHALVNSVEGIVWQAHQGDVRFTFVSQQAERLLGYPIAEWMETPSFWKDHIHPDDQAAAVGLHDGLSPEQSHASIEYRMMRSDGSIVWLRDMASVLVKEGCKPQVQGIIVDITERKRAEEKLKAVQAELESTNKGLVRRNQEIQNFYHTLSHELKTPLTSAREFASLLMEGVAGPLNETQLEYLGIIRESCDQLRVCIDDLLDTTRLETGKLALELKPAPLGELVQRVVTTMRSKAAEHGLDLNCRVQPNLPWVPMDEHRMTQVVVNLLNNAFKFTPPGGKIEIRMEEAPGQPEFLQVSVTDTGRGIPGEERERIFDRLYQVKTGDATTEHGIGLGLYICQELVRLHGGEIWAKSEPGKGSTFWFVIPKSQKLLQPNVLIIDDEAEVLATVEMALADECSVRTALDGESGLRQLRQQKPDVVVLDLSMPNLNGLETLKQIRRNWDSIPIIIHTAFSGGELMQRAMEFSPFTLLAKPCPINQVRQTVRRVLRSADTVEWTRNEE